MRLFLQTTPPQEVDNQMVGAGQMKHLEYSLATGIPSRNIRLKMDDYAQDDTAQVPLLVLGMKALGGNHRVEIVKDSATNDLLYVQGKWYNGLSQVEQDRILNLQVKNGVSGSRVVW